MAVSWVFLALDSGLKSCKGEGVSCSPKIKPDAENAPKVLQCIWGLWLYICFLQMLITIFKLGVRRMGLCTINNYGVWIILNEPIYPSFVGPKLGVDESYLCYVLLSCMFYVLGWGWATNYDVNGSGLKPVTVPNAAKQLPLLFCFLCVLFKSTLQCECLHSEKR